MNKTEKNNSIQSLKNIAIYLEGVKAGKGNIYPLGIKDLDNLWGVIARLNKL